MSPQRSKGQCLGPVLSGKPATTAMRLARRLMVLVVGGTLLFVGILLFYTPGPGLLVVPLGLSVLAVEFVWARRLLAKVKAALRTGRAVSAETADAGNGNDGRMDAPVGTAARFSGRCS